MQKKGTEEYGKRLLSVLKYIEWKTTSKISNPKIAFILGVSIPTLQSIYSGVAQLRFAHAEIMRAFGINIEYLRTGEAHFGMLTKDPSEVLANIEKEYWKSMAEKGVLVG